MPDIEAMTFQELTVWLRDRLQRRGLAGAGISQRGQEMPYDAPLSAYTAGERSLREDLERACEQLLSEVTVDGWAAEHVHYLLALVERGQMLGTQKWLEGIACGKRWLARPDGRRLHMLALRTLLGLGWRGLSPQFWMQQHEHLGRDYPAIVFRGLTAHGVPNAFERLPEIATSREAVQPILRLMPSLIEQEGADAVTQHVGNTIAALPSEVEDEIKVWFRSWGYEIPSADEDGLTASHFAALGASRDTVAPDRGWSDVGKRPREALAGAFAEAA